MTALLSEIEEKVCKLDFKEQQKLQSFLFDNLKSSKLTKIDESWLELSEKRYNDIISGEGLTLSRENFIKRAKSFQL